MKSRVPPAPPPSPKNLHVAQLLRGVLRFRDVLDPWLPFPQSACSFRFGTDRVPLPLGALYLLWEHPPVWNGPCPDCDTGRVLGIGFCGLFSIGGVSAYCWRCGRVQVTARGGIGTMRDLAQPALTGTPFAISGLCFGGVIAGPRRPLVEALRALGEDDLPGEAWVVGSEEPAIVLTGDRGRIRRRSAG